MADIFDSAMAEVGGTNWVYTYPLATADMDNKTEENVTDPISVDAFVQAALRKPGRVRTAWSIAKVYRNIPEFGNVSAMAQALKDKRYGDLPESLRLPNNGAALPAGATLGAVVCNHNDGTMDVIQTIIFREPFELKDAHTLISGDYFIPIWRPGPWAVKKAFHSLLEKVLGLHVSWASVKPKLANQPRRSQSHEFNATDDEIDEGKKFILTYCPMDEAESDLTTWIWKNVKTDSGTPIAGWPEFKARKIAENKKKACSGVPVERFFPLTVVDLHPVWIQLLLPLMIPLFTEMGLLLLGQPGVGKTPTVYIIAFLMGRYLLQQGRAFEMGVRRGKCWDDFKDRMSVLGVAAFLDDPMLSNVCWGDLKKFLCASDAGSTQSRYVNAQFCENQFRAVADNEFDTSSEPPKDARTSIEPAEFMKMMAKPFGGLAPLHVVAVLKRCVCTVAGENGFYVRFPSKNPLAIIHRIGDSQLLADWLQPTNKSYYGKFLNKAHEAPPTFQESLVSEALMVRASFAERARFNTTEEYVDMCNTRLQQQLQEMKARETTGPREVHGHIAASPEDDEAVNVAPEADGSYNIPIPYVAPGTSDRRRRFNFPGDRNVRLRRKSSPDALSRRSSADAEDAPADAEDVPSDPTAASSSDAVVPGDLDADEDPFGYGFGFGPYE